MLLPAFHSSIGSIDSRCLENSCNKLPRSGLLFLQCQLSLELDWREVAERRVQAFLVVDPFQEHGDRVEGLGHVAIFVAQNSSYFSVFMNDSHAALSHGLPLRLMLISIPCAFSRSV